MIATYSIRSLQKSGGRPDRNNCKPGEPAGVVGRTEAGHGLGTSASVAVAFHQGLTGLGLYIARQLCEANQSVLTYAPVPGTGSCFRIVLPSSQALWQDLKPP